MAEYVKGLFGGAKAAVSSVADADFADFASASPVAPAHAASSVFTDAAATATRAAAAASGLFAPAFNTAGKPYTKWYRVWERTTLADFYQEFAILPIILLLVLVHVFGVRANRARARKWAEAHVPLLEEEFAVVGQGEKTSDPLSALKENGKNSYTAYATGRQNIAFVDVRISLYKRYNPLSWFMEEALAFGFDMMSRPVERVEATAYCFDGKEKAMLGQSAPGLKDSSYDGFVWAVVHKDQMNKLRNDRYDVSLTSTKDHAKLPDYLTVMSESAEVTDALLTADLIAAITAAGQEFEALIISDQPIEAPKKLDDLVPRKRVGLSVRLNSTQSTALFAAFLRLPDQLVSIAHFRPEATRRIRATREEEQRKLRKIEEEEKSEERRTQSDKLKKEERDRKLGRMSAAEQKKFLEKEREAEQRKMTKKSTRRG